MRRNGYLIFDTYINFFEEGQKHETYSVTKSVTSALIGIAIDKGYIKDVNQTITQLFPNKKIDNLDNLKRLMTLKDLLMMTSGLDCNYGSVNQLAGTITMRKSNDWTQYNLNLQKGRIQNAVYGLTHISIKLKSSRYTPLILSRLIPRAVKSP